MHIIEKQIGETPLEALERFRATRPEFKDLPMTYAGRLDPMAEGKLIILVGEECKNENKDTYMGLDKEYEVEVVFGISTNTFDMLGIAEITDVGHPTNATIDLDVSPYIGTFRQIYPPYSSKTVNGRQLHELARADELPEEMPTKEVEIYSIELLGKSKVNADQLKSRILNNIDKVTGDFRQKKIKERWNEVLSDQSRLFEVIKMRVKCSSGTYMRSLADRMGQDRGVGAFALSIKRTKIISEVGPI